MGMSRTQFERRYAEHKFVIVPNVGPSYVGRYSVEVADSLSVVGCCNTIDEAVDLAEDYIEKLRELAEEDAAGENG